ncbi:MAG: excinuclease ABC subunit C, partial [Armatimonadetes bacterium]|nr:excinuclease ABC subunit C [Armatimonadota bacterium]
IDGGKGQLSSAVKALKEIGVEVPVCSLAKARTRGGFTRKEVERSEERVFIPNRKNPIKLKEGSAGLNLLQQVRDEAHRFSVKGHRIRRKKETEESPLTDLPGVGPKTKKKLLETFGTLEAMKEAGVEGIEAAGVPKKRAEAIHDYLSKLPATE